MRRLAYSRWQHTNSASHVHGLDRDAAIRCESASRKPRTSTTLPIDADAALSPRGGVLHLPIVGRHWRQHPQQSHRTGDPDAVPAHSPLNSWINHVINLTRILDLNYGLTLGESGWDTGMDATSSASAQWWAWVRKKTAI